MRSLAETHQLTFDELRARLSCGVIIGSLPGVALISHRLFVIFMTVIRDAPDT